MPPSRSSTSPIPSRCLGASSGSSGAVIASTACHLLLVAAEGAADRDPVDAGLGDRLRPTRAAGPRGRRPGRSRRPPGARARRSPCQARQRSSQRWVRSVERAVYSRSAWKGVHSSKTRAMSEPSAACTLHRDLGRDEQLGAVAVGAEAGALLADLDLRAVLAAGAAAALDLVGDAAVGEREDLEAAGVGDQRPLPAHEAVQPAGGGDPLRPRRDEQVVGVAEDQLVAELGDLGRFQPAHRPLRRQRDEGRRLDRPVGGVDDARAGAAVTGLDLEPESVLVLSHLDDWRVWPL